MINVKALQRKTNALLLTFCMTTGLFTGMPAKAAQEDASNTTTGLSVTDYIDWDEDGNPTGAHADADYYKDITITLSGATLSIRYSEDGQTSDTLTADDITIFKADGTTEVDTEEVSIDTVEAETDDDDPETMVQFECSKVGDYLIKRSADDTDAIHLYVELPSIGFYTSSEPSDETYLASDEDGSTYPGNSFYLYLRSRSEGQTTTLADYPENDSEDSIYPFAVYDNDFNKFTSQEDLSKYFSYEAVSEKEGLYKITLNPDILGIDFSLEANAKITDTSDGSSWNEGCWLDICAEAASERLTACSSIAFDDNGVPSLVDGAEWDSCIYVPMLGESYSAIKYFKESNGKFLSAQDITIYDSNGDITDKVTATDDENGIIRFSSTVPGSYRISYHTDAGTQLNMRLTALYPDAGFYTTDDFSLENMLLSDDKESCYFRFTYGNDRSFYCNIREDLETGEDFSYDLYTKDETTGELTELSKDLISVKQNTYPDNYTSYRISIPQTLTEKCYLMINYSVLDEESSHNMATEIELIPDPNYTPQPSLNPSLESASPIPSQDVSKGDASAAPSIDPSIAPVPSGSSLPASPAAPSASAGPVNTPIASTTPATTGKPSASPSTTTGTPAPSGTPAVTKEPKTTSEPGKQTVSSKKKTIKGLVYKLSVSKSGKATAVCLGAAKQKKTAASIVIPASVKAGAKTYPVTSISKNAFKGLNKLKKVTIGKNITTIGAGAFRGCKKLSNITIKSTKLKKVGSKAFTSTSKKLTVTTSKKKLNKYIKMIRKSK